MSMATLMALGGARRSLPVATTGMISTSIGSIAGAFLLIQSPILSQCVLLSTYLLAVMSLYAFGFGFGSVEKARLLKNIS